MKIGILTHYRVSSHGALLQMYGLQEVLKGLGHDVYILTYNSNMDFIDEETRKRFSASFRNLPYYLKSYLIKNGLPMLLYQYKKQRVLGSFKKVNFKFIPYTESNKLDCVVVGSDEVFALENGVDTVMFGHGVSAKKLIAYAPSFGQTDVKRIDKFGCRELIESGLKKFHTLSVRDINSQNIIEKIIGVKPPIICDPALLHDYSIEKKQVKKKYIVIYSYQSNFKDEKRIERICDYAKKHCCELWSVGVYYKWCDKKINCDPLQMLEIFSGAEAIITDTFHGTISSVIAKTPMAVFVRENNSNKLDYLLQMVGLTDRKVSSPEMLEKVLSKTMSFDEIDKNVKAVRANGLSYLKSALASEVCI